MIRSIGFTNLPWYIGHDDDGLDAQIRRGVIEDSGEVEVFRDIQCSPVEDVEGAVGDLRGKK